MERYENTTGTANKFWSIDQSGAELTVRWGPIGGTVSKKVHDLGTAAKAMQKRDALVREKLRGGYKLVAAPRAPAPTAKARRLKRRKKTVVKMQSLPASVAKQIDRVIAEVEAASEEGTVPAALVKKLLATAAKAPYSYGNGPREAAELLALESLIECNQLDDARTVWLRLIDLWSKNAPLAGGYDWAKLAQLQQALKASVPAALRTRVAEAWALGGVSSRFSYENGTLLARTPKDGAAAWRQACIAITQHEFEIARAAANAVRAVRLYARAADIVDIMLLREQGDAEGAAAAYREVLDNASKRPKKENWREIAALHVLVGIDDRKAARQIVTHWKAQKQDGGEADFFAALTGA